MLLSSVFSLLAVGAAVKLATAPAPAPAAEVKPVQVEVDAAVECANASDFLSSLRSRTHLVRQAVGDEPRTTIHVRLLEMRRNVLGELRMVDDRGETDTRRVQGTNCDDVVQALSLAAAVALDPSVLLPGTANIPAPATTIPATPPPTVAQAVVEPKEILERGGAPFANHASSEPRFELGAAAITSALLSSGMSQGVAIVGRWTPAAGHGPFRPTMGAAATHVRDDVLRSPGVAQASLTGLIVTLCVSGWGSGILTVRPCGMVMAGLLAVRGNQVARSSTVDLLWLSAGAVVRMSVRLGRGFSLDLETGFGAPLIKRELYTTLPSHVVARTPAISLMVGLGLAYGF